MPVFQRQSPKRIAYSVKWAPFRSQKCSPSLKGRPKKANRARRIDPECSPDEESPEAKKMRSIQAIRARILRRFSVKTLALSTI